MQTILISGSYDNLSEAQNTAGVYIASGLAPSSFNPPVYYGSSANIYKRIASHHLSALRGNYHHSPPLQRYYNKHGEASLVWAIVEKKAPEAAKEREQHYLDTLSPYADTKSGFNISKNARGGMLGRKQTEKAKRRISASKTGKTPNVTPETKKRIAARLSQLFKGKSFHDNERLKKTVTLRSPRGEIVMANGIAAFCRSHGLTVPNVTKLVKGERRTVAGWTNPAFTSYWSERARVRRIKGRERILSIAESRKIGFVIVSPSGEQVTAFGLSSFARQHGLSSGNLAAVLSGKRKHCKGWRLPLTAHG